MKGMERAEKADETVFSSGSCEEEGVPQPEEIKKRVLRKVARKRAVFFIMPPHR
jgi:hypothetical protein